MKLFWKILKNTWEDPDVDRKILYRVTQKKGTFEKPNKKICRILQSMQHTQGDTKERELLKCVVAVKECIRGGGRHLQDVIFRH